MPSQKQDFAFPGQTSEQLLLVAYGTFLELGWTPKYAGPTAIVGHTPRSWKKYDDEIVVEAIDGSLTITSSLVHNESFDLPGKNKKHINDFTTAFEKVKASGIKTEWAEELDQLRRQTAETAQEQEKQAGEINEVMHFSRSKLYVTYTIIAINAIIFILMAIDGAGIFDADGYTHVRWGSNYSPLTLSGDWWRLLTCMFIHFGLIHLVMNLYALYTAGVYLEPMLGKARFILAYLCTGVIASIVSLWWHREGVNSAGASGAIFGMYGVFLALLFTNLIPKQIRKSLLQSIAVFVVFNLIYGMKAGIDNAAHVGGLLSGIVIGFVFYPLLKKNETGTRSRVVSVAIAGITALLAWMYLYTNADAVSREQRQAELNYLKETQFTDGEQFMKKYNEFAETDGKVVKLIESYGAKTYAEGAEKNESELNKEFQKAAAIIDVMKTYDVSDQAKRTIDLLEQLLNARKEEVVIIKRSALQSDAADELKRMEIRNKQEELVNELKSK